MEAVIGVIQSQAKEHLEPPESGRGKEIFHPRAFGGSMTLQIPWFCTSGLQYFFCFKLSGLWRLVTTVLGNEYTIYTASLKRSYKAKIKSIWKLSYADINSLFFPSCPHFHQKDFLFGEITFHNIHTHAHTHKHTHTPEIKSITMEENRDWENNYNLKCGYHCIIFETIQHVPI